MADQLEQEALARQFLAEGGAPLVRVSKGLPQQVVDAHDDLSHALDEHLATSELLRRDLAELDTKRDIWLSQGIERKRGETIAEAKRNAAEADERMSDALARMRAGLVDAAQPRLASGREPLARDELRLLTTGSTGDVIGRLLDAAQSGSNPEALAALSTNYGKTALAVAGIKGRDQETLCKDVRTLVASVAAEKGTTDQERLAGSLMQVTDQLAAVRTAAGGALLDALPDGVRLRG